MASAMMGVQNESAMEENLRKTCEYVRSPLTKPLSLTLQQRLMVQGHNGNIDKEPCLQGVLDRQ
jgi:hypothetical protein